MTEIIKQYLQDDIELARGGGYHETYLFYEDDGVTPKDTTNWALTRIIQKSANGEIYDMLTTDSVRIINTPGSGQFNIKFTKVEIEAFDFMSAVYRDILDYGDGSEPQVIAIGNIRVI